MQYSVQYPSLAQCIKPAYYSDPTQKIIVPYIVSCISTALITTFSHQGRGRGRKGGRQEEREGGKCEGEREERRERGNCVERGEGENGKLFASIYSSISFHLIHQSLL